MDTEAYKTKISILEDDVMKIKINSNVDIGKKLIKMIDNKRIKIKPKTNDVIEKKSEVSEQTSTSSSESEIIENSEDLRATAMSLGNILNYENSDTDSNNENGSILETYNGAYNMALEASKRNKILRTSDYDDEINS